MLKKVALLLVLVMLFAQPAMALTVSEENTFPLADEKVEISIWAAKVDERDYENCLMTRWLEETMNIDIKWDFYSSSEDGNTKLNLMLANGEYPDILMGIWFNPTQVAMCVEAGAVIPLNDLIASQGYNYRKALEENPDFEKMLTANDGNIYTFMYTDAGVHKASEYKMWYRPDWLANLGLEVPTTTQEFKDYLIAIRDNDANGNGDATDEIPLIGFYNGRKSDPICFLMNPFELYNDNYYYITDEGQIHFSAITDGWREGLKYIADLYAEGLIDESTYVQDQTQFQALLNKPTADAIVGNFPFWFQGGLIDTTVLNWTDYEPLAPLEGPTGLRQSAARFGGNFNLVGMISSQCEHPEIAFKLLDYFVGEEGVTFGHYGIEGETYEWVDEPSFYGDERSIKRLVSETEVLWNPGSFPRYDRAEIRYATTMNEDSILIDNTYVLVHAAQTYEPYYVNHHIPDIVWCEDEDVTLAVSEYATLINDYIKTMDTQFVMGALDINDDAAWQAYLDELNAMGLEDYIAQLETYYGLN